MQRLLYLIVLFELLFISSAFSQDEPYKEKRRVYFTWGWNKDWFTKSNLHFSDPTWSYNFTLYGVSAHDNPRYDYVPTGLEDFSIPQYSYRLGWLFKNQSYSGIEINFDHAKYIIDSVQTVHLKGTIDESVFDQDTLLTKEFLKFEHTNGANFYLINYFRGHELFVRPKFSITAIGKAGAGVVVPKTDVTIFTYHLDNRYHLAGWMVGLEGDIRFLFWSHLYVEGGLKLAYCDYMNVLVIGDGNAHHTFGAMEAIWGLGYQAAF